MSKNGKSGADATKFNAKEDGSDTTVTSNTPANRLQSEAKVDTVMDAADTRTNKATGVTIKEDTVPAQVVHTKKVSEIVTGGEAGSALQSGSGVFALRPASYSGIGDIAGDFSSTTTLNKADRSGTRSGKKLDNTLKHINYLYNEQVTVHYDESKPLAEAKDQVQGYNGTYFNEHARTGKASGFVPADLYYERSIDEIHQDFIYPVMGQSINDPEREGNVTGMDIDEDEAIIAKVYNYPRGNYMPGNLHIKFNKDGSIDTFEFADYDITPNAVGESVDVDVANISAYNAIIDANTAELDRQKMDANAGNEALPGWSPLPRAVQDPTPTISLIRDIEASTGSEVYMAYKKTAMAMSYQLNKTAKDGQRLTDPIKEFLYGCVGSEGADPTVIGSEADSTIGDAFSADNYSNGSPAAIIELFDSKGKYTTKGDFLLQPRGFRMHLQTAANNMKVLKIPSKFVEVVNANEVFSTIDKPYDPFLPVCISDKASLAHPRALNAFIEENKPKPFKYSYTNNTNNTYIIELYHPLIKGLYDFFAQYGSKFASMLAGATNAYEMWIPCIHSTTSFSLWSLVLLAAVPQIVKARLTSLVDVFDYEKNHGNPFSQLTTIGECDPMAATNYTNSSYEEPIKPNIMRTATALRWMFPETYWTQYETTTGNGIVLPWYHNEESYTVEDGKLVLSGTPCIMSMPSIRSGSRLGVFDTIYSLSERDVRLSLDRQTVYPKYKQITVSNKEVYKYGLTTDGQIRIYYGDSDLTLSDIYKTPREIGWVIPAFNGSLTKVITEFSSATNFKMSRINLNDANSFSTYAPGFFRIRYWYNGSSTKPSNILAKAQLSINRGVSLQQVFKTIMCQRRVDKYNDYIVGDFLVGMDQLFDYNYKAVEGTAVFTPFTSDGVISSKSDDKVVSLQKYYWTRVQRLPFVINPFECLPVKKTAGVKDSMNIDPYDFLYIFGCAGFRASDYNEDNYNREKLRLNLGMMFVEDPYFTDSPAYRPGK